MAPTGKKVVVYHATPLCKKCRDEISKIQMVVSASEGVRLETKFSLWERLKYGLQLMMMPVIVIGETSFSVLGAFKPETLTAELKEEK